MKSKQHRENLEAIATLEECFLLGNAVDGFATQMKHRLIKKHEQHGDRGWADPGWHVADIKSRLIASLKKGNMVDVANFAMFIWHRTK